MLSLLLIMVCPRKLLTKKLLLIQRISVLLRICKQLVLIPLFFLVPAKVLPLMALTLSAPLLLAAAALACALAVLLLVMASYLVLVISTVSVPPQVLCLLLLQKTRILIGLGKLLLKEL